jgi:hypothetical protein
VIDSIDPTLVAGICEFIWDIVCIIVGVEWEHRSKL